MEGFRVWGLVFGVSGLGFKVKPLGLETCTSFLPFLKVGAKDSSDLAI